MILVVAGIEFNTEKFENNANKCKKEGWIFCIYLHKLESRDFGKSE
jgi:hypothetical protein